MNSRMRWRLARRWCCALLVALGATLLCGCLGLGTPKLEDRWTRIDLLGSNVRPYQTLTLGARESISVQTTITYRSIVTGFEVAELRASTTITPAAVQVYPEAPRLQMAQDIDQILQHSVTLGRATRAVTGWDHLIQRVDLAFAGTVPAVMDSAGNPGGLFLLCYMGSGQRIELQSGADSIIITPFVSSTYQLLPVGMGFATAGPRGN